MSEDTPRHDLTGRHGARGADSLPREADTWLSENPGADRADLEEAWRMAGSSDEGTTGFVPDPNRVKAMEAALTAHMTSTRKTTPSTAASKQVDPGHVDTEQQGPAHVDSSQPRVLRLIRPALSRPAYWAAAAVVVLAVVGLLTQLPTRIKAPVGETVSVQLPDGSSVQLNSGSHLTYTRDFGEATRTVKLDGEGFFDVVASDLRFEVQTFNGRVSVLGTRFNVRAWSRDPGAASTVTLQSGRVRFSSAAAENTVVLLPGQQSRVIQEAGPSTPAETDWTAVSAWQHGGFIFSDASMGEILAELKRRTGDRITVTESEILGLRASIILDRLTGSAEALEILSELRGLDYRLENETHILSANR